MAKRKIREMENDETILTLNCSGLKTSKEFLIRFIKDIEKIFDKTPAVLLLQEIMIEQKEAQSLSLPNYRPIETTKTSYSEGEKIRIVRGSMILVRKDVNTQHLEDRSENQVEIIGIKVIGDNEIKYLSPIEIWSVYSGSS